MSARVALSFTTHTWHETTLGPTSASRPHEIFEAVLQLGPVVNAIGRVNVFDSWHSAVMWHCEQLGALPRPTGGYRFPHAAFAAWAQQSWAGDPLVGELLLNANSEDIRDRIELAGDQLRSVGESFFKAQAWTPALTSRWNEAQREIAALSTVYAL